MDSKINMRFDLAPTQYLSESEFKGELIKPYVIMEDALSEATCDELYEKLNGDWVYMEDHAFKKEEGGLGGDKNINAKGFMLDVEKTVLLHNTLNNIMVIANRTLKVAPFQSLFMSSPAFVSEYWRGCFRSWHRDGQYQDDYICRPDNNPILIARHKMRVLSSSTNITGGDYKGGEFELFGVDFTEEEKELLHKKGTTIVFPSSWFHRVKRVKSGIRYSLIHFLYSSDERFTTR